MPFIASLGRRGCNDCRIIVPQGQPVYLGTTGMLWCPACAAANLGVTMDAAAPPAPRVTSVTQTWSKAGVTFRNMKPTWTERED